MKGVETHDKLPTERRGEEESAVGRTKGGET